MSTSRFNNRKKTNKKHKAVADDNYNLIFTGKYKEVDVPELGRFLVIEDEKPHCSKEIIFAGKNDTQYTHRGSLHSIIVHYKVISTLSPRVKYIIERAGWDRLLNMELAETPHSMVDYIVERFWDTTNTFHFPFGEIGFTPLDWVMLTGVSIGDALDIPYDSEKYHFEYVRDNIFPDIQDVSLCPKGASWKSNSITVKFLGSYFTPEKLSAAENDKVIADRVATAFFMYVLGQFFFSNSKNYIDAGWLAAFDDLDLVGTYDWGGAAFSRLYAALRIAGRKRNSLCGPFQILEFWGYEYLGICAPDIVEPKDDAPIWPTCSRWKRKKKMVDIVRCRYLVNKLTADQVTWQPWESCRQILEYDIAKKASILSNIRIIFSWNTVHNMYLGERCWRQKHLTYGVPIDLHIIVGDMDDKQGKRVFEAGWSEAKDIVRVVSYDMYMQYWRKVTNFKDYVIYPTWDVQVYGNAGDLHNYTIEKPAEHVDIPPQHQISPDESYSLFQEHADFGHQLRIFTLNHTKEQSEIRRANEAEIERLRHHNHMLELQISSLHIAQQSQPLLGFGPFSQTIPATVWNTMGQGSTSTMSSVNPTPRVNVPFNPPRSSSLVDNTSFLVENTLDMNG